MVAFNPIPTIDINIAHISIHGLMIAAGFVVAVILARREAKRRGLSADLVDNAAIIAVLAGLIGARLFYVLEFGQGMGLLEMFEVWKGGLSSHGGYLFGIVVGLGYLHRKRADVSAYADAILPYILIGWAIGRIGCFLNWDSYGAITTSWLSVIVYGEARYPTQLFESAGYLISFGIVYCLRRLKSALLSQKGIAAAFSLGLFALTRFVVDFFRGDSWQYLLLSRIVTLTIVFACFVFIVTLKKFEDKP
jgi:phosphatidylglycerol---prolipoprotein diacylglyceryl transferase